MAPLARAVLVLDENNTVTYAEYVDNINTEPDYDAADSSKKYRSSRPLKLSGLYALILKKRV